MEEFGLLFGPRRDHAGFVVSILAHAKSQCQRRASGTLDIPYPLCVCITPSSSKTSFPEATTARNSPTDEGRTRPNLVAGCG